MDLPTIHPTAFTPLAALLGGALLGAAAVLLMLLKGRIAGISGIAVRALPPYQDNEAAGRIAFVLGLVVTPAVVAIASGAWPTMRLSGGPALLVVAGLLVGFGAVWGNGCTSGHGVCGLSRLSLRSLAATLVFMTTAVLTVFILRHLLP
jgi:uncharacterized membrane protein YedE/YeeE